MSPKPSPYVTAWRASLVAPAERVGQIVGAQRVLVRPARYHGGHDECLAEEWLVDVDYGRTGKWFYEVSYYLARWGPERSVQDEIDHDHWDAIDADWIWHLIPDTPASGFDDRPPSGGVCAAICEETAALLPPHALRARGYLRQTADRLRELSTVQLLEAERDARPWYFGR